MEPEAKHRPDADAVGWRQDEFSADLGHGTPPEPRTTSHHEPVAASGGELTKDERARLTVLAEGTRLEGGSTYVDVDDLAAGPFTAEDGQTAEPGHRLVSKRDTDYELWNRLVGRDTPTG
jgi:hypothetical protein